MNTPVEQIKSGNKIIIIKRSQIKNGWPTYNIKQHLKILIDKTNDDELEYVFIKRKKFLIIVDNDTNT